MRRIQQRKKEETPTWLIRMRNIKKKSSPSFIIVSDTRKEEQSIGKEGQMKVLELGVEMGIKTTFPSGGSM